MWNKYFKQKLHDGFRVTLLFLGKCIRINKVLSVRCVPAALRSGSFPIVTWSVPSNVKLYLISLTRNLQSIGYGTWS